MHLYVVFELAQTQLISASVIFSIRTGRSIMLVNCKESKVSFIFQRARCNAAIAQIEVIRKVKVDSV